MPAGKFFVAKYDHALRIASGQHIVQCILQTHPMREARPTTDNDRENLHHEFQFGRLFIFQFQTAMAGIFLYSNRNAFWR